MSLKEYTEALLARYHLTPRRSLSQHFLIDPNILDRIVTTAQPAQHDHVVEIGAGTGVLTGRLASRARRVTAIEVDARLCRLLRQELNDQPNVDVVQADALRVHWEQYRFSPRSVPVLGNLPYHITSPVLFRFSRMNWVRSLLVLVQREVAARIVAHPGTRTRGLLSVWLQYVGTPLKVINVPPQAFIPAPAVGSTLVHIPLRPCIPPEEQKVFLIMLRAAFSARRKMLRNTLASALALARVDAVGLLDRAGIDSRRRAETLTVDEFRELSRLYRGTKGG